jgi:arsenite methyltransferase
LSGETQFDLKELLALVDKTFGIKKVMSDQGRDVIAKYYEQSGPAYERVHSKNGCMHLALNSDGVFAARGYRVQPKSIIKELKAINGTRALEFGCGKGFNSLFIAQRMENVQCTGTDLLEDHIVRARGFAAEAGQSNVSYEQASFEPLPDRFRGYDVAFGFETLCYARDTDLVARSIAESLRPGGRFVIYDVHAWGKAETLSEDLALATRLYEIGMAVTNGFRQVGQWEASLAKAGLIVDPTEDLTLDVQPGLKRLQDVSLRALGDWKKRLAIKVMPPYMARNGISGLFGPLLYRIEGKPNPGVLAYPRVSATKPL